MIADLAAWLLADDGPIAEDEQTARDCLVRATEDPGPSLTGRWELLAVGPSRSLAVDGGDLDFAVFVETADTIAHHAARWDPARVLAECAAKRQIVAEWQAARAEVKPGAWDGESSVTTEEALRCTVHIVAKPYAGRPGWHDEWSTA